jgi:phosphorylase/glycogen(starch) synthase
MTWRGVWNVPSARARAPPETTLAEPFTLFEVSWEVCNKVGGIHTVLSTKAKTLVERMGDDYVAIGPWLLSEQAGPKVFEEEACFDDFCESCRRMGVPVRVGRWLIPGRPRAILVEFSGLFAKKDGILSGLWERFHVDSLFGGWDYVEPVLFGHAAGMVIQKWWQERLAPQRGEAVAQFHEWMTGSGLLYLNEQVPAIGTVFTTHATMLGRSIASRGLQPVEGLEGRTPEEAAKQVDIVAKHSMEGVCARDADVFTTVSQITADEAEVFHRRKAEPLLPNGIDLEVVDEMCGGVTREEAEQRLRDVATRFTGEDCSRAALLGISGRYEFHNKGIDLLLESLGQLQQKPGAPIVCLVLVPAGNSGLRREVSDRMRMPTDLIEGPIGISTHNLFEPDSDPVQRACARLGLSNKPGSRVKVVQIPVYLNRADGLLNIPYEAALRAMSLSCFPSFYEPWGYTPEESLAVGVPTLTTDCAGFGRWASDNGLGSKDGVYVLPRIGVPFEEAVDKLAHVLDEHFARPRDRERQAEICRATARRTAWTDLIACYDQAFHRALVAARDRNSKAGIPAFRPRLIEPTAVQPPSERPRLSTFDVAATLPSELKALERIAHNYWWSWNADAAALFERLSPRKWSASGHNPLVLLRQAFGEDLDERAADAKYLEELAQVARRFDDYVRERHQHQPLPGVDEPSWKHPIAYFCAEFAIHESLPIYSGGLGVLAGDHLKSASDLNLPLIGIGLFYRKGYFRQRLGPAGEQLAQEADNDPAQQPLELVRDDNGDALEIKLQFPSSELVLRAWKAQIGRVPLYLLDSDVPANRLEDRSISHQLYGGDHEGRLRQEIVLGRGGARLLERLGIEPSALHLNEGHAAFAPLERAARLAHTRGLTFEEARALVKATTVFTTHTPVPAGHDRFSEDLLRRYFSDAPTSLGMPWERFLALGQSDDDRGAFNMTYLALHFASFANGVSQLHRDVSRRLLQPYWPKLLELELPIDGITNGIHLPTWTAPELAAALGAQHRPVNSGDFRERAEQLAPQELWRLRARARARLIETARSRLRGSFVERNDSPTVLAKMLAGLDGDPLIIGFARRFAPYKRAQLLFRDPDRLARLLARTDRPIRFFFAGKAHPADRIGQDILRKVVEYSRSEAFAGKVFFFENYDVDLARALVQGVDVWLNNPIRTQEASGTSGMKVAANGGLNLSIADGWWIEAADGVNGWTLAEGRIFGPQELQDEHDSTVLYRLLEEEIAPLYYERDAAGVPQRWLTRVKRSLATIPTMFNTDRMVAEYRERAYRPLSEAWFALSGRDNLGARELAARHARLRKGFADLRVLGSKVAGIDGAKVGDGLEVQVDVDLGALAPEDVQVELVYGHVRNGSSGFHNLGVIPLGPVSRGGRVWSFVGVQRLQRSGSYSYGVRLRARVDGHLDAALRDLVIWA